MTTRFHKMHGLGNDFVVIDARATSVAMDCARAHAIADRHTGIGCDQLVLLEPSITADARMRIFNADGGEVEACGNAARAVALLLGDTATLETLGGTIAVQAQGSDATVDMGMPRFAWDAIPLAYPIDTAALPLAWENLAHPGVVNVGNPHAVFFVDDSDAIDLARLGPIVECDPIFPERVNVGVATVTGTDRLRLRVWERGVGLTQACGTGACAAAVLGIRARRVAGPVTVELPGGALTIAWTEGGTIRMTGPARHVFTGEIDLEALTR